MLLSSRSFPRHRPPSTVQRCPLERDALEQTRCGVLGDFGTNLADVREDLWVIEWKRPRRVQPLDVSRCLWLITGLTIAVQLGVDPDLAWRLVNAHF